MNKLLIVILAKAAAGKDTMVNQLVHDLNIHRCISYTTRDKREGETDGVEYYFISDKEFDKLDSQNEFIEKTSYYIESEDRTYRYGYTKSELNKSEVAIIIANPHGYRSLLETEFKDNILSIQIVRNDRDRGISYLKRDENATLDELTDRHKRDKRDFEDLVTDRIIYNDNYIESYTKLVNIIKEEMECLNSIQ
ncbi:MAG: hypothetical protein ACRDDY_12265 [Clostridium sp.]|uniref:hypothetical protein n=1 Tax=Clostridium sp. TaxID=1506 RepID=UPI003EE5DA57